LSCRLNALNCISSRRSAGKLFHTRGPATEKLLSPKVLLVRCMGATRRRKVGGRVVKVTRQS